MNIIVPISPSKMRAAHAASSRRNFMIKTDKVIQREVMDGLLWEPSLLG